MFNDLYENALTWTEQHMLRLCAHYRERIPDSHVGRLDKIVNEDGVCMRLVSRCLLTASPEEYWYVLHTTIGELTRKRMDRKSDEYWSDHETIADAWLAQLKIGTHSSSPNIQAANEGLYHLIEGESYERFFELSDKLLIEENVVPELDRISKKLSNEGKHKENRYVLELLVKLIPREPRYHRFLAQTVEKLEGPGHDEALTHYRKAFELTPEFPACLADYAKCLRHLHRMEEVISIVEGLDKDMYRKIMNDFNIAIYTGCLEEIGQGEKASALRWEYINNNSTTPVFYNDEANYLLKKEKYDAALAILEKAASLGCADEYTKTIKAKIKKLKGGTS